MREQLEAAIEANPDDTAAYLVYADWLQSHGDPRGELVMLQHAGKHDAAQELIDREQLLGRFATFVQDTPAKARKTRELVLAWRLGFLQSAHIGWEVSRGMTRPEAIASLEEFLALPSARFLEQLGLGPVPTDDFMSFDPWLEVIAEHAPQSLRSLYVGDIAHWDISSTSAGPFAPVLAAHPRLRSLVVHAGDITLGALDHGELRELAVRTGGIGNAIVEVGKAKLPALERLEVWLGTPRYGGSIDIGELAPILDGAQFPALRHLGLMNAAYTDDIVRALITSPILPRLASLDLSMGTLSDDGVRAMVAARDAFAHLDALNLDDNALTEASRPLVDSLAKSVHFGSNHDDERIAEADIEERYTSVGE